MLVISSVLIPHKLGKILLSRVASQDVTNLFREDTTSTYYCIGYSGVHNFGTFTSM